MKSVMDVDHLVMSATVRGPKYPQTVADNDILALNINVPP